MLCGSLFSPVFCDTHSSLLVFVLLFVSISVSLFFLLVLKMWQKSQIVNSELFVILIFKTTDFLLYFKLLLCQMVTTEMSVNSGSSRILPLPCSSLPLGFLYFWGAWWGLASGYHSSSSTHTGTPCGFCHSYQVPVLSNVCHHSVLLGPTELLPELDRSQGCGKG